MKIKLKVVPTKYPHTVFSRRNTRHLTQTTYFVCRGPEVLFEIQPSGTTKRDQERAKRYAEGIANAVNKAGGL